jgi:hypothetical protein
MKILFLIIISMIALAITLAVQDSLNREYERGYQDGMRSLSTRQVDNLCIKWWFQSDLEAAKKRACGK